MDEGTKIQRLNRIGIALSSIHDLTALLEMIVSGTRSLTGSDAGSLYLKEGDELSFSVAQNGTLEKKYGKRADFFKPFRIKISKNNIAGFVALSSKPLNIQDAYALGDNSGYSHSKQFDEKYGYRTKSILTLPMIDHKDQIIGILQLINALDPSGNAVPFSDEHVEMAMSIASQAAVAINNARFIDEIKDLFKSVVQYSAMAIDARSPHTAGHSERVASLSLRLAQAVNEKNDGCYEKTAFSDDALEELRCAAWLHDIGKIGIKEIILDKERKLSDDNLRSIGYKIAIKSLLSCLSFVQGKTKGQLPSEKDEDDECTAVFEKSMEILDFVKRINVPTEKMNEDDINRLKPLKSSTFKNPLTEGVESIIEEDEYENLSVMRGSLNLRERKEAQSHVVKSVKIVEKIPFKGYMKNIPDIVANHHEYIDGSGYPGGKKGDAISVQSRILCIADIFDALVAKDRPYKPSMPIETALSILKKDAHAGKLDPNLVELFIEKRVWEGIYQI